jgi:voltage-gated potassium channel
VLVVLLGLAVLSLVTASVAAVFVGHEERDIERELMKEIRALRAEVAALHQHQQKVWGSRHNAKD